MSEQEQEIDGRVLENLLRFLGGTAEDPDLVCAIKRESRILKLREAALVRCRVLARANAAAEMLSGFAGPRRRWDVRPVPNQDIAVLSESVEAGVYQEEFESLWREACHRADEKVGKMYRDAFEEYVREALDTFEASEELRG